MYKITPEVQDSKETIVSKINSLLEDSIKKTKGNIGVLFSGGLDSTLIAFYLKKNNIPFTCYTATLQDSTDYKWSKKVAKLLNLKHKIIIIDNPEEYFKKSIKLLNSTNVVNIGIASTLLPALEQAKKDNINIMFLGSGSEDVFGGYARHVTSKNINEDCLNSLNSMKDRDFEREKILSETFNIKFLEPFLSEEIIKYGLRIPGKYKVQNNLGKYIIRELALYLGLPEEIAFRKRLAAQYGSSMDKQMLKLAKKNNLKTKTSYLEKLK